MAVYKVPQDVEAEDKLIGPFSFRQFIYLIITVIAIFIAWLLSKLFIGLIIIPLPIILLFGALALPLRKDQPMEVYLTAVIKFFLKPRIRLWSPDGSLSMVTITVPKVTEYQLTKDFNSDEAQQRLSYLAQIVDTRGWSSKGVLSAPTSLTDTVAAEARSAEDILDASADVAQSFDNLISRQDAQRKQTIVSRFQQAAHEPTAQVIVPSVDPFASLVDDNTPMAPIDYNPYPSAMHQRVLQPASEEPEEPISSPVVMEPAPKPPKEPVTLAVSPDIMRLANNNDLSISAIAHEAHRLESKNGDEVIISLR